MTKFNCIILRIYKEIKKNPKKIFIRKDFGSDYKNITEAVKILKVIGIIEIVPVIYYSGEKKRIRRDIKGFRFKQIKKK